MPIAMIKKKMIRLLLFLVLCHPILQGQELKQKSLWRFRSINQIGLLEGQAGSAFQLQTVNGMQYKSWFAGIGVGIDYYQFRGIPLFLDLRKSFGSVNRSFFIYADAGTHFAWATTNQHLLYQSDFSNGLYTDFGIGYQIRLGNNTAVLLSAGYSYKQGSEKTQHNICPFAGPCYDDPQRYDYDLNRLLLKAGISF